MLQPLQAFLLGIVEGVTEFLPISSTAHLILTSDLLKIVQDDFMKSFDIFIQLGAISAVVALYWRSFTRWEILKRLIVAFIPTGTIGFIFYGLIKSQLLGSARVVLWSLFIGGIFLIIFEWWHREKNDSLSKIAEVPLRTCVYIGLFQSVSMIPGVSRSAATIIGGLFLGLHRETVVEFSFLLAVPTMLVATTADLWQSGGNFSLSQIHLLLIGFVTSFFMAIIGIRFLLSYVRQNTFTAFGIYRILLVAAFLLFI